jgi:hypothetical protein
MGTMFLPGKPKDGLAALHAEIAEEKAGALGRIAEKLEARLAECARLAAEGRLDDYERVRADAKLHYWYLVVQREAVGMYDHRIIAAMYPIPPRLK